jgi:hypothetical protein
VALDADALDMSDPATCGPLASSRSWSTPSSRSSRSWKGATTSTATRQRQHTGSWKRSTTTVSAASPLPSSRRTRRNERTMPVAQSRRSTTSHDPTGHEARKEQHMATLAPLAPGTLTEKQHEVYELIRKADGVIDNQAIAKGSAPRRTTSRSTSARCASAASCRRRRRAATAASGRSCPGAARPRGRRHPRGRPRRTRRTRRTRHRVHGARQRRGRAGGRSSSSRREGRLGRDRETIGELDRARGDGSRRSTGSARSS